MFNVVSRIYQPSSGAVLYRGTNLIEVPAHGIARLGIARTFQNLALFPSMTLLENVMVGAHSQGKVGFARAVFRLGAAKENRATRDFAGELLTQLGLGPLMFRPAMGLPFGTLKRLEIARALAAKPDFLLMDEPASGLTHGEVDELGETIVHIRDQFDLTVLLVEHHMSMVMSISDKVVAMEFGRKIAEGTPAVVQADERVITSYLGTTA
jgi:branched-chain amino acid transport system ATP-binding protein